MTWLAWRQFRLQMLPVYAAIAVLAAVFAAVGPELVGSTDFLLYQASLVMMYLLPAAIGLFWGAPLIAREVEAGTLHLVWDQSVTRQRWLAVKLLLAGPAAMLAAGLLSLTISWWAAPVDTAADADPDGGMLTRLSPVVFATRGIVPVGHAAFAFALGVVAGILLRRTVAAMAVTLAVLTAVLLAVPLAVRPHLLPPTAETVTISTSTINQIRANDAGELERITVRAPRGAWVLDNETLDRAGAVTGVLPPAIRDCLPSTDHHALVTCVARLSELGHHQRIVYQPANRFWPLQSMETALYFILAGLLTWFAFRRLRHLP